MQEQQPEVCCYSFSCCWHVSSSHLNTDFWQLRKKEGTSFSLQQWICPLLLVRGHGWGQLAPLLPSSDKRGQSHLLTRSLQPNVKRQKFFSGVFPFSPAGISGFAFPSHYSHRSLSPSPLAAFMPSGVHWPGIPPHNAIWGIFYPILADTIPSGRLYVFVYIESLKPCVWVRRSDRTPSLPVLAWVCMLIVGSHLSAQDP